MEDRFELTAPFKLSGDQPQAVEKLVRGLKEKNGTRQMNKGACPQKMPSRFPAQKASAGLGNKSPV